MVKKMEKDNRFYLSLAVLYICLVLAFNNTSLFVSFFLFAGLLFFWVKIDSIAVVLWYTFLASLPFDLGKGYPVPVVMPKPGAQGLGYRVWLTISPSLILVFLLLFIKKSREKTGNWQKAASWLKLNSADKFWFLLLLLGFLTVVRAPIKSVVFYGWIELFKGVAIYFLARRFLINKSVLKNSRLIIFSWLFFEGLVSIGQFLFKGPVGLYIEEGVINISFGKTALDSYFLFRSFGTFVAPNRLAAFLVLSLLTAAAGFFKPESFKSNLFSFLAFISGLLALILSLSRTSWLAFSGFFTASAFYLTKKGYVLNKNFKRIVLIILLGLIGLSPILAVRIESLLGAFSYYGTGSVRWKLIKEALHLIKLHPFLGVGFNHFTQALVKWPATDVRMFFLQPVHNIYLLLAAEAGLPALFCFLLVVILILKKRSVTKDKLAKQQYPQYVFLKSAVFSYLFIGLLEPFLLQPVFELFLLILAMLEVLGEAEK